MNSQKNIVDRESQITTKPHTTMVKIHKTLATSAIAVRACKVDKEIR